MTFDLALLHVYGIEGQRSRSTPNPNPSPKSNTNPYPNFQPDP